MSSSYIARIFGRSPFGPMQAHIDVCYQCALRVTAVLDSAAADAWDEVARLQAEITRLENDADKMKTDIRTHLPRGFFLPVSRPDLLDLLTRQDRIANRAKGIAGLILGRKLRFPAVMEPGVREFAAVCISACGEARDVVHRLDQLLETGFGGRETDEVRELVARIGAKERECDELEVQLRAELFQLEEGMSPINVLFLFRVLEWIGDLANHAEQVGHRLDQLLAG
jgi:predicted phosphate transport protein (TIGR00153 family)